MQKAEFLSVAEFAERAKVSQQSVYKRLNTPGNKLLKYVVESDGRRMIKVDAIAEVYGVTVSQSDDKPCEETANAKATETQPEQQRVEPQIENQVDSTQEYIEYLKTTVEDLKRNLEKDAKTFSEALDKKDEIIKQQSEQLSALTNRVATIAEQALLATQQQQALSAADKIPVLTDGADHAEPEEQKRRGFFARLFHR